MGLYMNFLHMQIGALSRQKTSISKNIKKDTIDLKRYFSIKFCNREEKIEFEVCKEATHK